jgi:hypothetical protein
MVSFNVLGTPRGILRLVEILFAIIAFATMADQTGFDSVSEFQFVVAANVLAFIFAFILLLVYIFQDKVDLMCLYTPIIELVGDGILTLLLFIAGIASAVKCSKSVATGPNSDTTICKTYNLVAASVAFTFLTFALFAISTYFSYRLNVEEERKPETTNTAA